MTIEKGGQLMPANASQPANVGLLAARAPSSRMKDEIFVETNLYSPLQWYNNSDNNYNW